MAIRVDLWVAKWRLGPFFWPPNYGKKLGAFGDKAPRFVEPWCGFCSKKSGISMAAFRAIRSKGDRSAEDRNRRACSRTNFFPACPDRTEMFCLQWTASLYALYIAMVASSQLVLVLLVCLFYVGGPTAKGYFKGNRRWEKERRGRQLKSINDPEERLRDRRSSDRGYGRKKEQFVEDIV